MIRRRPRHFEKKGFVLNERLVRSGNLLVHFLYALCDFVFCSQI